MEKNIKQILIFVIGCLFSGLVYPQYKDQGSSFFVSGLNLKVNKNGLNPRKSFPEDYVLNRKDVGLANDGIGGPISPFAYSYAMQNLACGNSEKWIFPSTNWKNDDGWKVTASIPYVCFSKEGVAVASVFLGDKGYLILLQKF